MTKLAMQMPVEALLGLYSSVGFGELSGLNLVGEVTGIFPTRTRWSPIERATIAFGYGLSITPIQLAHAYATLGNLGKYEPIHIIESNDHDMSRQVVSAKYARQVLDMLETVTQKEAQLVERQFLVIEWEPKQVPHVKRLQVDTAMSTLLIRQGLLRLAIRELHWL